MKEMQVEVLDEPMDYRASERMKRIVMTEGERALYVGCPNAARNNKHPGYKVDDDSGYGDSQ